MPSFVKRQDRLPENGAAQGSEVLDPTALLGTWVNTNSTTRGITKAVVSRHHAQLSLRVYGASGEEPYDWGEVKVNTMFTDGIGSRHAISFTAEYDFEFLKTELQTNLSKGLLIVTSLNTFKDGSARSDYFAREYFFKQVVNE